MVLFIDCESAVRAMIRSPPLTGADDVDAPPPEEPDAGVPEPPEPPQAALIASAAARTAAGRARER